MSLLFEIRVVLPLAGWLTGGCLTELRYPSLGFGKAPPSGSSVIEGSVIYGCF